MHPPATSAGTVPFPSDVRERPDPAPTAACPTAVPSRTAILAPASPPPVQPPRDTPTTTPIAPARAAAPPPTSAPVDASPEQRPRRFRVHDALGRAVVAREYAGDPPSVVLLPDGQLGWLNRLDPTDQPFEVEPAQALADRLLAESFPGFESIVSTHYVVLYECRRAFAEASVDLLESLYLGLTAKLREKGLAIHDAEFPLVAVIYRDEARFHDETKVAPDIQAFYNVVTNRVVMFESRPQDQDAPDMAARRRPQTVAHEGTHQVLQNIGLHPRLSHWPPWLIEGLAEYFAPTTIDRNGHWDGANKVNPFHLATIRDLQDPLADQLQERGRAIPQIGRGPGQPIIEPLVMRENLSPTDYALAWALTHYLANKRFDRLIRYLTDLSTRPLLQECPPADHLVDFQAYFGDDLDRLDRSLLKYLAGFKNIEGLAYYAVLFEQPFPNGIVRRAALVSQSPAMIRQWVEQNSFNDGLPPKWHALAFPTHTRARFAAETWFRGR